MIEKVSLEFRIAHIFYHDNVEEKKKEKVKVIYKRNTEVVASLQELDLICKRSRVLKVAGSRHTVLDVILDIDEMHMVVMFKPHDETLYNSKELVPFKVEGWTELRREIISSRALTRVPRTKKHYDEDIDDDDL